MLTSFSLLNGRFSDIKFHYFLMTNHDQFTLLGRVCLFLTPWTAACQASLSFSISQSLLKLLFIELVVTSNHLILCCPPLLLPLIFLKIGVFSNEWAYQVPRYTHIHINTNRNLLMFIFILIFIWFICLFL